MPRTSFVIFFCSTFLLGPLPRTAMAEMEEIIVSADFRAATVQDLSHSVSVLSGEAIKDRGASHFEEVIGSIPNLNFAGGTGRTRFFQIRGIGERSQFESPLNPSVGLIIDGVDFSGAGSIATLHDVDQVEVLRGPQGTRYGANALAGLIHINTRAPSPTFGATINAGVGQFDSRNAGFMVTGPLSDQVSVRLTGEVRRGDGYTYNAHLDRDDVNYRDEYSLRAKLRFDPTDTHRTDVMIARASIDNGYDVFSLDNTRTTWSDEPGRDMQQSTSVSINSKWMLDGYDVNVIASASDSDTTYGFDEDWVFAGFHPDGYDSADYYFRDRQAESFELRFVSNEPVMWTRAETDWVMGLYLRRSDENLRRQYTFLASDFTSDYDHTTIAGFIQLDTHLSDRLTIGTGARVEQRDTGYQDSEAVWFNPTETLWGGNITVTFDFDHAMTYLRLARGYKAGGFNTDGSLDADLREFQSEYLWEIEAGIKGTWQEAVRFRLAVFNDYRRDQQVKSSIVRVRGDGSTEFIDFLGNAAEGRNLGIELEADWRLSESLSLFAGAGLLRAKFDTFINEFGEDLSGRDQAHAPAYTFSIGANFSRANWFARLALDGKDDFYFSDRHDAKSDAYLLVNASIGYGTPHWTVRLWGRNLGDTDYYTRGFGSFGNDPRKGYVIEPYYQFGEPGMIGVDVEYRL